MSSLTSRSNVSKGLGGGRAGRAGGTVVRRPRWPRIVSNRKVDGPFKSPYAGFVNLQIPPELEAKLTRLATETGRTVDEVALDLLAYWV